MTSIIIPRLFRKDQVEPRLYQVKIFERAIQENVLIVIPTGLGKTLIGALVASHFLEKYNYAQKIIFLAPTRPLINQHLDTCEKLLEIPKDTITILTGQIQFSERILRFNHNNILLMTPETLINDLEEHRYTLSQIALIIYDEAHRATGDYAYVRIAKHYKKMNPKGRTLALTASPGSTPAKIKEICLNLNIDPANIEYRNKESQDVKQYTFETEILTIPVEMTESMASILKSLQQIFEKKAYQEIQYCTLLNLEQYLELKSITQRFCVNLQIKLGNQLKLPDLQTQNQYQYRILLSLNAQLLKLINLIKNLESEGLLIVIKTLQEMLTKVQLKKGSKADEFLISDFIIQKIIRDLEHFKQEDKDVLIHPKLKKLLKILTQQFEELPHSRVLIFTKLRHSVNIILEYLKEFSGFRAMKFIGQASKSASDKGLTQKAQLAILQNFRQETVNILVATNIAEEGLDIAECNLVIFYDNIASDIRYIQRMGRTGRTSNGRAIILYTKGTSDEINLKLGQIKSHRLPTQIRKLANTPINDTTAQKKLITTSQLSHFQDIIESDKVNMTNETIENNKINEINKINEKKESKPHIKPKFEDQSNEEVQIQLFYTISIHPRIKIRYIFEKIIPFNFEEQPYTPTDRFDIILYEHQQEQIFGYCGINIITLDDLPLTAQNFSKYTLWQKASVDVQYLFVLLDVRDIISENSKANADQINLIQEQFGFHVIPFQSLEILTAIFRAIFQKLRQFV